jgi:hypothetical protein
MLAPEREVRVGLISWRTHLLCEPVSSVDFVAPLLSTSRGVCSVLSIPNARERQTLQGFSEEKVCGPTSCGMADMQGWCV